MRIQPDIPDFINSVDFLRDAWEAGEVLSDPTSTGIDKTEAIARFLAAFATGVAIGIPVRMSCSTIRLGLAITGNIWKWEAITALAGAAGGVGTDLIINELQDFVNSTELLDPLFELVDRFFSQGQKVQSRRDPLTFDLDGDGLETIGVAQSGVLFDHDGDGIREGTGWVLSDDGFLVLDRNGNGTIDSGKELFGDSTPLSVGGNAADGFTALLQEDTNQDGVVNSTDARWNDLRVWRDLNQDGVSQTGELLTLADLGIVSINVAAAEHSQVLPDGNRIADLGSYTKADGSSGTVGDIGQMVDIDLSSDTFHREFTDIVPLNQVVAALPNMQASGKVRDLWEAASQSGTLYASLAGYSAASTRAGQLALLDDLVAKWSHTAGLQTMEERATSALASGQNPFGYGLKWDAVGTKRASDFITGHGPGNEPIYDPQWIATVEQFEKELYILEAFNGRYFFTFPWETPEGAAAIEGMRVDAAPTDPNTGVPLEAGGIHLNLSQGQIDLLNQSYQALKASVYDSLILQTRFKPLLDAIELVIGTNGGIALEFSAVQTTLQTRLAQDSANGMIDLIEFNRSTSGFLAGVGWEGDALLETSLRTLRVTPALQAVYDEMQVRVQTTAGAPILSTDGDDVLVLDARNNFDGGGSGDDVIFAGAGIDRINGGSGNDRIYGGAGDDGTANWFDYRNNGGGLYGDAGDDVLEGGAGDDYLEGGSGSDLYRFGLGDGQDILRNYNGYGGWSMAEATSTTDDLLFKAGIAPADVRARRVNTDLVLGINATTDSVTIKEYFGGNLLDNMFRVDSVRFADGTAWDADTIQQMVLLGTVGNDTLFGVEDRDDTLQGFEGNDTLTGFGGNDTLLGGAGNDTLSGNEGSDTVDGGAGDDFMRGDAGNDTYLLGRGDGHNQLDNYNNVWSATVLPDASTTVDAVRLKEGVAPGEVSLHRTGSDLEIKIGDTGDTLTATNQFGGSYLYSQYGIDEIRFADGTIWGLAQIHDFLVTGTAQAETIRGFEDTDDLIQGFAGNDTLWGLGGTDTLEGGDGADILYGGEGNDILRGGAGNDSLSADGGEDVLDGGAGNDWMRGYAGNDAYLFGVGDAADTIENYDWSNNILDADATTTTDAVQFKEGVLASDIVVSRNGGNDLILLIAGTADSILVRNQFSGDSLYYEGGIDEVRFADATTWSRADIGAFLLAGTLGNDTITAFAGDDTVNGLGGNDTLSGKAGNDTLVGGTGNDTLIGGTGSDVYVFATGDGQDAIENYVAGYYGPIAETDASSAVDTLSFGTGIMSTDMTARRDNDDLVLTIGSGPDSVRLKAQFASNTAFNQIGVDEVRFDGGAVWTRDDLAAKAMLGTAAGEVLIGFDDRNDVIEGFDGNDILFGQAGNDQLRGGAGLDSLQGNADDDTLDGGAGNDTDIGGTGSDTYLFGVGDGQDWVQNFASNSQFIFAESDASTTTDAVQFKAGVLAAGVTARRINDDLVLTIASTSEAITISNHFSGNTAHSQLGIDEVRFADGTVWSRAMLGAMVLMGTAAGETITGTVDDDYIDAGGGNDIVRGGLGNDTLLGGDGNDPVLDGEDGNDQLIGGAGSDGLYGRAGNDILDGGADNDTDIGGTGSDTYLFGVGDGQDWVQNFASNSQFIFAESDASTTTDAVQFKAGVLAADVTARRTNDDLVLTIASTSEAITISNHFSGNTANSQIGIDEVRFADGTVWSRAMLGAMVLMGTAAGETITGTVDDDTIDAGGGNDIVRGGLGNDTLLGGDGNDILLGEDGNDQLLGGDGSDTLYGQLGDDMLDGGAGNDTLNGATGSDTYQFGRGDGQDVVQNYGNSYGSPTTDASTTTDVVSFKSGVAPADVTARRNDTDLVLAITGATDTITIADQFRSDSPSSQIGVDEVRFADGTVWNRTMLASLVLVGTSAGETLTGFAGTDDIIDGLAGNDTIYGRSGNDTLYGGDGVDSVQGDDGDDQIYGGNGGDALYGFNGNDTLLGQADADWMYGGTGDDSLDGGTGNDPVITGGTGNDTYWFGVGDGQDFLFNGNYSTGAAESDASTTTDILRFKAGVSAANVMVQKDVNNSPDLVLTIAGTTDKVTVVSQFYSDNPSSAYAIDEVRFADGTVWTKAMLSALVLTGTSAGETLVGFANVDDTIDGLAGNDRIWGRSGNDTLHGGDGNDLLLGEDGNDQLFGGNGSDTLYGQLGNDILDGGADNDTMSGGAGDDTYVVDNASDFVNENAGEGTDKVQSSLTYTLGTNVENLTLTGTAAVDGIGNSSNNILIGNSGNNTLTGGAGNDTLDGGAGNDTLIGGAGSDIYLFGHGSGLDTISDNDATAGNLDVVRFASDIAPADVTVTRDASHLYLSLNGGTDRLTLQNWFVSDTQKVERVEFANGTLWDVAQLIAITNQAPTVANEIADQTVAEDAAFSFQVPADSFADVDSGDSLSYSAKLSDGSALPSWLTFNAATRTFSGTPLNANVGTLSVKVTATDAASATVSDVFDLVVANTNDAPLANADALSVAEGETSANLAAAVLANDTDVDVSDSRTISAVSTIGTLGTVEFNLATQSLVYSAAGAAFDALAAGASATDTFAYTLSDTAGATSTAAVTVTVIGVNDAPIAADDIATVNMNTAITLAVRGNDRDPDGDALMVSAVSQGANGTVSLDPTTGNPTYTPNHNFTGTDAFTYTLSDGQGGATSATVSVTVSNVIRGDALDNTLRGSAGGDIIRARAGNDWIDAGDGNDTLNGGAGADTLLGGPGDDTYVVDNERDVVTEGLDEGIDTCAPRLLTRCRRTWKTSPSPAAARSTAPATTWRTGSSATRRPTCSMAGAAPTPWPGARAMTPTWWTTPGTW